MSPLKIINSATLYFTKKAHNVTFNFILSNVTKSMRN